MSFMSFKEEIKNMSNKELINEIEERKSKVKITIGDKHFEV